MAARPASSFGANTEKNPKEECRAVLTRSQRRAQEEEEKVEEDQPEEGRARKGILNKGRLYQYAVKY